MTDPALATLFLAYDQISREIGDEGGRDIVFLNALPGDWPAGLRARPPVCYQPRVTHYRDNWLKRPEDLPGEEFECCLILGTKNRTETRALVGAGLERLKTGGLLITAAANDAGGKSLPKIFKTLGLETQSLSKNKSRAVVVRKDRALDPDLVARWTRDLYPQKHPETGYWTCPGLFGWDKTDPGSNLLARHLPRKMPGQVADFGCGYGFLLDKMNGADKIHALDVDIRALECARLNMAETPHPVDFIWADCSRPVPDLPGLDMVVMNPPFHADTKTDINLGQSFIMTAAHHLKDGGRLYMVANRHLPYEKTGRTYFRQIRILEESAGYKVIEGVK